MFTERLTSPQATAFGAVWYDTDIRKSDIVMTDYSSESLRTYAAGVL
jgi:hypothetical protein